MFFDRFEYLCSKRGISCGRAAAEMGLSNATATKWKKTGATPKGETLSIIAKYFGVSVGYLLGEEENKKATDNVDGKSELDMEIESLLAQISDEKKQLVLAMLRGAAMSE